MPGVKPDTWDRFTPLRQDGQPDQRGGRRGKRKPPRTTPYAEERVTATYVLVRLVPGPVLASNDHSATLNKMAVDWAQPGEHLQVMRRVDLTPGGKTAR